MKNKTYLEKFPKEITTYPQWVLWRIEYREGKPTKVPISPHNGRNASVTDATTWGIFDEAFSSMQTFKADGLGFVFTKNDPYTGVDLDKCIDPQSGVTEERAQRIIEDLNSYTEKSPSGTGFHIIVKGELPPGGRRKGKIEMYESGRYFTMTGDHVIGTSKAIEERNYELSSLHESLFGKEHHNGQPHESPRKTPMGVSLEDAELINRASNAENGDKFKRLWSGNWSGYPSQSEADQALCNILAFWTGKDHERIDCLFRQSGLYRKKWDEKHYGDGRTYGEETIDKAIKSPKAAWTSGISNQNKTDLMFPMEALPPIVHRFIKETSESLPCPPDFIAIPFLTAAGAAIGTKRAIRIKPEWEEYPLLYSAIVGRPGDIKSPALKKATEPIRKKQEEFRETFKIEQAEYEVDLVEYEKALGDHKNSKREFPPDKLVPPILKRTWTADTTTEKLATLLDENRHGMILIRDELTAWVKSLNQYKGGKGSDRQVFLSNWGSASFAVDRQGKPPIIVDTPFLSVVGCIPPDVLSDLDEENGREDGFIHRVLWSYPTPVCIQWTEIIVSKEAKEAYHGLFESLFNLQDERVLTFTPEAKNIWIEFHNENCDEMQEGGLSSELHGPWAKLKGYCTRLALILALCENPQAETVNEEAVLGACALVNYFKAHARKVYPLLKKPKRLSEEKRCEKNIIRQLERGNPLKKRDLQRNSNHSAVVFNKVWEALVEAERLTEDKKLGFWKLTS